LGSARSYIVRLDTGKTSLSFVARHRRHAVFLRSKWWKADWAALNEEKTCQP
jgi:hypothetical protein